LISIILLSIYLLPPYFTTDFAMIHTLLKLR
jgi:hypothetical protein